MRRRTSVLVLAAMVASTLPVISATAAAQEDPAPSVVISQVYGGGGNSGALYRNDFVELFNRGDLAQDISGWSLQYTSANGNTWGSNSTTLPSATLEPGQRYLVEMAAGANTSATPLPTPDHSATGINMAGTNGKIALASTADALPGESCPTGPTVVDAVGYGTQNCAAIQTTTSLNNNASALRNENRCGDTFSIVSPPEPENSSATRTPCTGPQPAQPIVPTCRDLTVTEGTEGSATQTATDADSRVDGVTITQGATEGIALEDVTAATEDGGTLSAELTAADTLEAGSYTLQLTFTNDDDQSATCNVTVTVQEDVCRVPEDRITRIHEIQGPGSSSPIAGQQVTTRGVVTSAFPSGGETGLPANHGLRGFFIEAIVTDRDSDDRTSEGVFVFDFDGVYGDTEIGDLVYVSGEVQENFGLTQVASNNFDTCAIAGLDTTLPPPAELPLPTAPGDRAEVMEPLESMRVTHSELTLVEFFQLERFGDVRLSSGGVFDNPTNVVDPRDDEAYNAIVAYNAAHNIILSSGRTAQNINRPGPEGTPPLPFLEPGDTLRIGDQLIDQTFVLHFSFSNWRLQPIDIDELSEEFQQNRTRPRPHTPPDVGGSLLVASYNVLNYFDGDGQGGGFPTARGAKTQSELDRQTEKLVAAVTKIDADVVGLIEMENDGGEFQATRTFVEALNEEYGEEVYDFIDTGVIGTDAIKQAFIYKPSTVEPTGDWAILDSSVDPRFEDRRSRPALAQTFTEIATGEAVTVTVNHLKSKGSACNPEDNDPRQGNCNGVRERAAEAIVDWLATEPTGEASVGHLVIGDINAYAKEDPIRVFLEADYTDLLDHFAPEGETPYSYTFDATQGYLDHALADEDLLPFVTGAAEWHINADETQAIDYQEGPGNFRTNEVGEQYYQPNEFRSSDHDPVIVGLDLGEDDDGDGDDPVCKPLSQYDRDRFTDTRGSAHERNVLCMADRGLTEGLRGGDRYGPRLDVNRGQMASFIARFIEHATGEELEEGKGFRDVPRSYAHAENINKLENIGVTSGTARSNGEEYAPLLNVSRAQMASFISRALTYIEEGHGQPETVPPRTRTDHFPDDDGSAHEDNINALAEADIVKGYSDGTYRWRQSVKRDQMASFVIRAYEYAVTEGSAQVSADRR
jgi:uncharacterized protein